MWRLPPIAQRIEQWFPKPCAQVRVLVGGPDCTESGTESFLPVILSEGTVMERVGAACGVPANSRRRVPEAQRSLVLAAQTRFGPDCSELTEITQESTCKMGLKYTVTTYAFVKMAADLPNT